MSTTTNPTHRNQEPEPVRPRIRLARLFRRRPTIAERSRAALMAVDPAEAFASGMRQADERRKLADDLQRWKGYADDLAREAEDRTKERDDAQRECAQLLAWIAVLHPATTVIAPAHDGDGSHDLYLVAGGWQMSWHIHPRDADLFKHVTAVDVTDVRAQWDGHGTVQKYERIHNHVRLLALDAIGDGPLTGVTEPSEVRSA